MLTFLTSQVRPLSDYISYATRCLPSHEASARSYRRSSGQGALQELRLQTSAQVGSHIVLETDAPVHHRLSVPDHDPLRVGILNSVLTSVAKIKGIPKGDILKAL